jgi:hypothetical protein
MSDTHSDLAHLRGLIPRPGPQPLGDGPAPPTFTAALVRLHQWLRTERSPFVLVESLSCAAWTRPDVLARFSRPGAFGRTQRYSDIVPIHAQNARRP